MANESLPSDEIPTSSEKPVITYVVNSKGINQTKGAFGSAFSNAFDK